MWWGASGALLRDLVEVPQWWYQVTQSVHFKSEKVSLSPNNIGRHHSFAWKVLSPKYKFKSK